MVQAKMLTSSLLLLLSGLAAARRCANFTIPVDLKSRQGVFKEVPIEGNLDTTAFGQEATRNGANYTNELLQGYATVTGSYKVSAQFCYPDSGPGSVIQVLTHGIGFDKVYWDLSYNNFNYSYVSAAVKAGYSTLAIDRLGIGNSSHGDPLNEIQAQLEVEALNAITTKLRTGSIPEIKTKFSKVIHVGHSFGSVQTLWLSALYPNNTDGLVLTGWSASAKFLGYTISSFNLHSARLNQPLRFGSSPNTQVLQTFSFARTWSALSNALTTFLSSVGITLPSNALWNIIATTEILDLINSYNTTVTPLNYPSGYMTWSSLSSNQYAFLLPGHFDIGLGVVSETLKQPVTTGELLTIGSVPAPSHFTGPVFVITGSNDVPFCGGDCYAVDPADGPGDSIPEQGKVAFPNASVFEAYIQPKTAHGNNVHYNATAGYEVTLKWLAAHGLGA